MNTEKNYRYIDIFSGCGGLSLGLCNSGWQGILAIEKNEDAFSTLKHNLIDKNNHFSWPDSIPLSAIDINEFVSIHKQKLLSIRDGITLIAGGPPCQGFSVAGQRQEDDGRNKLVDAYIQLIEIVSPQYILFENVKGFTIDFKNGKVKNYKDKIVSMLDALGYSLKSELLNFSDFGLPQNRTRFILFGVKKEISLSPDAFFSLLREKKKSYLCGKALPERTILKDAISDIERGKRSYTENNFSHGYYKKIKSLYQKFMRINMSNTVLIPDSHRFANHTQEIIRRFTVAIEKKMTSNEYKNYFRLNKNTTRYLHHDQVTPTLTSLPDDFIHYKEPRILTVREMARLQSFPDDYEIKGKYTTGGARRKGEVPRYTQVANAIPPLFAELAGLVIKELIDGKK